MAIAPTIRIDVLSGSPEDRPEGFPCFHCGKQVREERGIAVTWPDGRVTMEALCPGCLTPDHIESLSMRLLVDGA